MMEWVMIFMFIPMILLAFGVFVLPVLGWIIHSIYEDRKEILRLKIELKEVED